MKILVRRFHNYFIRSFDYHFPQKYKKKVILSNKYSKKMFTIPKICVALFCKHQRIGNHKLRIRARVKKLPPAIPLDYTGNVSFQTWLTRKCFGPIMRVNRGLAVCRPATQHLGQVGFCFDSALDHFGTFSST